MDSADGGTREAVLKAAAIAARDARQEIERKNGRLVMLRDRAVSRRWSTVDNHVGALRAHEEGDLQPARDAEDAAYEAVGSPVACPRV